MKKSIHHYFFLSIAAVLIITIVLLGITQSYLYTNHFTRENEVQLQQVLMGVQKGIKNGDIELTQQGIVESEKALDYMALVSGTQIFLTDLEGNITLFSDMGQNQQNLNGIKIPTDIINGINQDGKYSQLGTLDEIYSSKKYTLGVPFLDPKGYKQGYLFANNQVWGLKVYVSDMLSSFFLSAALAILIASVLAWVLTKRTLIPINKISETAKRFGEGDYSARVEIEGDNEIAQLAVTFNEMANSFTAADASRRSFMGNIAHELRTPMTTIKGFIDGMLDGTIPNEQRDHYLAIVSEEVGRLARLTHNMLDISKLEAGEYDLNPTNFDIWGPLAQVFINSEKRLAEKNITLEGMDGCPPAMVMADQDFVHQILFNLVDNAIKFTQNDGKIQVSVKTKKNVVTVGIRNNGEEIPENVLPYIFDRFYKGDASRGINAKGSGLGLHICKVLVGLMGGRIWAESENKSTVFYFTLPAINSKNKKY